MHKVFIGIPSTGVVSVRFLASLLALVAKHPSVLWGVDNESNLPQARSNLASYAKAQGCSHILYLDTDMTFPEELLDCLLAHNKDVVGVNFCTRRGIPSSTTFTSGNNFLNPNLQGLLKVGRLGFGAVLIDLKVFDGISKPWFNFAYVPQGDYMLSETFYFCDKVQAEGYEIFVDCDLSRKVGHLTETLLTSSTIQ